MVAPFATLAYTLPPSATGKQVSWQVINDYGGLSAQHQQALWDGSVDSQGRGVNRDVKHEQQNSALPIWAAQRISADAVGLATCRPVDVQRRSAGGIPF